MSDSRRGKDGLQWHPSRFQYEIDWWARWLCRAVIGPGVIAWELFIDNGHDLAVVLIGGMLTMSLDVTSMIRKLLAEARQERSELEKIALEEEKKHESERDGS
jgi:hypothetical protein